MKSSSARISEAARLRRLEQLDKGSSSKASVSLLAAASGEERHKCQSVTPMPMVFSVK